MLWVTDGVTLVVVRPRITQHKVLLVAIDAPELDGRYGGCPKGPSVSSCFCSLRGGEPEQASSVVLSSPVVPPATGLGQAVESFMGYPEKGARGTLTASSTATASGDGSVATQVHCTRSRA